MHLWAGSEHEVYAALDFLRSDGSGAWSLVDVPPGGLPGHGGGPGRRLRAGNPGALPLVGEGVAKMPLDVDACMQVLGKGGALTCFYEKRVVHKARRP